eukprot:gene5832-9655_t
MLLTKILVCFCFVLTLVQAQKYAIGKIFEKPGCNENTQLGWTAVEMNRCYTEGSGVYGKLTCEGDIVQAHMCFDSNCEFCQIGAKRPTGCNTEIGINYSLQCGDKPQQRDKEIYASVYQSSRCEGDIRGHVGVTPRCISGPGISVRAQCNEREGRYIGEQFDNLDCTPPAKRVQYVPSGCNSILGLSYYLPPCGKNKNSTRLLK